MILIKTNEGNYYGFHKGSSVSHTIGEGCVLVWLNGHVIATCKTLDQAQKAKDEIVRLAMITNGNAVISIKESEGGVVIEIIIDDL